MRFKRREFEFQETKDVKTAKSVFERIEVFVCVLLSLGVRGWKIW